MSRDSFTAVDDAGNRYTVHIVRSYINTSLSGSGRIEGFPSYRLANGGAVNKVDSETFQVVATDTTIKVVQG